MTPDQIKNALVTTITDAQVEVHSDGSHVHLCVVSPAFVGLTPVKKQQLVYGALQSAIADGSIHAVHMQTFTPEEWGTRDA